MPALVLLGRRRDFGTDDFVVPGLFMIVSNAVHAGLCFGVSFSDAYQDFEAVRISFVSAGACSVFSILLNVPLAVFSNRGAVLDPAPRAAIPVLLQILRVVIIAQIAILIFGTVALSTSDEDDSWKSKLWIILLLDWASFVLFILLTLALFNYLPSKMRNLVRCFGWLIGKRRGDQDIVDVQEILNRFVRGMEVTTSDLVCANLLMMNVQCAARKGCKVPTLQELHLCEGSPWGEEEARLLDKSRGGALPGTVPITDCALVEELLHNLAFPTAVLGLFWHLLKGRGSLTKVHSENSEFHLREKGVLAILQEWPGHQESRLIYVSKANDVKVVVYAIFVDMKHRNVVIALRGTLSISDAITDVLAHAETVSDPSITGGKSGAFYVHSGMWQAANHILADLDSHGVVARLLSGGAHSNQSYPQLSEENVSVELPNCAGFGLLVTGHSLGSGTGQLLTALLRPRYPDVRFIGYGSPHVWSEAFAQYMSPCMTQVICGDDVIPRLSLRNAEFLRDRMLALMVHCPWGKNRIIRHGITRMSRMPCGNYISPQPINASAAKILAHHCSQAASPQFFHSGRICYLRVTFIRQGCCGASVTDVGFRPEWAESDHFMEMVLSRRMVIQHLPENYRKALECARESLQAA